MKKIAYLALSLAIAIVLTAGVAFAAWKFETAYSTENTIETKRDDIFENYNIRKANETEKNKVKTYEMYLYPSTLYLNEYIDSLNGKSGAVLPEEKYGYIEPVIENGIVKYNVVSSNGGDSGYLSEVAQNKTYTMSDTKIIQDMYYNVYKNDTNWDKKADGGPSGTINFDSASVAANSKFLYGDPIADLNNTVTYSYTDEQHNWRNLHYYDRFGYWPTLAKDAGRYLPLKITVDEKFNNSYYNQVDLTPFADMGDPHDWYVYSFSCWSYVNYTNSTYTPPYYATDEFASANSSTNYVDRGYYGNATVNPSLSAFCPTTVSQYFDIMKSFEVYSDADNVIRLFPKFSQGKGYGAAGSTTDEGIKNGGGDSVKVVPTYKNADGTAAAAGPTDQHELYMFYTNETGSVSKGYNTATVRVSVLPNVDIDSYFSLDFKIAPSTYVAGWTDWSDVYSLNRDNSAKTNLGLSDMLAQYGYGLYNLYLFVTNVSEPSYYSFIDELETMRQNIVSKKDSTSFPSLFGKNLLPVASLQHQSGKSIMLVGEKVREAKFIGDVNFTSDKNAAAESIYTSDEQARDKYLSTDQSFRLINKELYGTKDGKTEQVNSYFPYCYILQKVDFTKAKTQFFQIRFQRAYRSDLHFADPDNYAYSNLEFSGTTYEQGFGNYFELVNDAEVYSSEKDSTSTQQVMKLKSEEMRGVYDIIMVFRSAREADPNSPYAYNIGLYAYRHTDIFLKIFENDLTDTVSYTDSADGVIESPDGEYKFIDHYASPLFVKNYSIEVTVKPEDQSDKNGKTLAQCINEAVTVKGCNPATVRLYDHVTQAEVACYAEVDGTEADALNYNGKYYKLVFHPFKIRKNYIFYIKIV